MEFVYDSSGLSGFKYNREEYLYQKNIQGDIIAILNLDGEVIAEYRYDAWGNCEYDLASGIATANPFRYRGYYYDQETGLYFLQTRYYDPEVGRFISQDDVTYLDPEHINGLNLYAYCMNNPVMMTDPDGTLPKWLKWLVHGFQVLVGAVLIATGVGAGFGTALIMGGTMGMISEAVGSTIGGGVGSMLNGWGAISTGLSLCAFGPFGIIAGVGLMAVGGATMAMGANEVVSGITGTNYLRNWIGHDLYDGLYLGLNIASGVGTIAGRLGMRTIGTSNCEIISGTAKPYARHTLDYKTVQYDGRGNLYWSIHNTNHGKSFISNPHWHIGAGGGEHYTSYFQLILGLIRRF